MEFSGMMNHRQAAASFADMRFVCAAGDDCACRRLSKKDACEVSFFVIYICSVLRLCRLFSGLVPVSGPALSRCSA